MRSPALIHTKKRTPWLSGKITWILLLVLVVYGPVLVLALSEPATATRLEGVNYFADTLMFAGTILALASASGLKAIRAG